MKKPNLSLKWLHVFLLTARSGAVQTAAEEAGLSVSTVSHHLRRLEETLGVTLFDHNRRPLRLTTAGAVFYRRVEDAMRLLAKAELEVQSSSLTDVRNMSLALIEEFDSEIGPDLARHLATAMPKCLFRHLTRPSHETLQMVRDQDIDIGIAARPQFPIEGVTETPLLREPFVLALPSSRKANADDYLSGESGLPLLRFSKNHIIAGQIEQHLRRVRLSFPERFEFESNQTLMNMVAEGDGWAITTPLNYLRARRFHRMIRLAPFPGKSFARYISIFTSDATPAPAKASVSETMRRLLDDQAIRPVTDKVPWLADLFQLLPDDS